MFPNEGDEAMMQDNITNWALKEYQKFYKDESITKKDIFYYTYGILHHVGYREKYKNQLGRGIPHIPMAKEFKPFRDAGYELGQLHMNYETCDLYELGKPLNDISNAPKKIKFEKNSNNKGFNHKILIIDGKKIYDDLPVSKYKVNGRTPIQWFQNNYGFSTNGETGITNYPLEGIKGEEVQAIIERLCYVGVRSDEIMEEISKEEFEVNDAPKYNTKEMNDLDDSQQKIA